jgi:predicted HD phosphohydrolase
MAAAAVDAVFALFAAHGSGDYVGEAVSQEQHATQAAALAAAAGLEPAVVAASLLHDVGHMVGLAEPTAHGRMGDCGTVAHEGVGASWLADLRFAPRVAALVRRHVDAKRYLCAVDAGYEARLSPASRTTLGYQGGPMAADEVARFNADAEKDVILKMRGFDEAAKDPAAVVPPLASYRALLEALVEA